LNSILPGHPSSAIIETANAVNNGAAPIISHLSIISKANARTEDVIDWERSRYRIPFTNPRNLPPEYTAYQIEKEKWEYAQNDKMW
jgi:hypothetical protein